MSDEKMSTKKKVGIDGGVLAALTVTGTIIGIASDTGMIGKGDGPVVVSQPAPLERQAFGTAQVPAGLGFIYSFSSPTTQSSRRYQLTQDTRVEIKCTEQGETISNGATQSSLWDYTDLGYLPDALLYTGTEQAQKPSC